MIQQNVNTPSLVTAIRHAVSHSLPLSVIRCGDGEMHILKNANDFSEDRHKLIHYHSLCTILARENIWRCNVHSPGTVKPIACSCYLKDSNVTSWLKEARTIISSSIKNSDYVGLVVPEKNQNYYTVSKDVIRRYGINPDKLKVISSLFPREEMFGSLNSFRSIIRGNGIHIITPNVDRFINGNIDKLLGVNVSYTDISGGDAYEPKIRNLVKESIKTTDKRIVLFGGGYAIKDLIPWSSKEYGKISLDVGSVLDAWSGYQSRLMFLEERFKHLTWIK